MFLLRRTCDYDPFTAISHFSEALLEFYILMQPKLNRRRNEGAGETGDPRQYPPTNGIVRHDPHMRKSGVTRPGFEHGSPWWKTNGLNHSATAVPNYRVRSPAGSPNSRMWESCRTMPLVGGSSRESSVPPALSFRRCSIPLNHPIGSQDLAVKSHEISSLTHSFLVINLHPNTATPVDGVYKTRTLKDPRENAHTVCSANERYLGIRFKGTVSCAMECTVLRPGSVSAARLYAEQTDGIMAVK
ncbi:hypothetical protein PR048_014529 [Dryococelus australis]|uniref:Uncharacterized protein n=1 Tax=Dryococelus australis TaxID=614101 RepID=A0ABQ9HEG2_9NEOP|nr:hypothetical protein PR048_014529 [Dryococelus australis]